MLYGILSLLQDWTQSKLTLLELCTLSTGNNLLICDLRSFWTVCNAFRATTFSSSDPSWID
jgi:hypothetical protein